VDLLRDNDILLLFVVAGLGYLIGKVRIAGFALGVSAVLFAGLALGALDPELEIPRAVWTLGLVLFVYTIGLATGPGFVAALRRRGAGTNLLALGVVGVGALTVAALGTAIALRATTMTGTFTGALTNTPALAAAVEEAKDLVPPGAYRRGSGELLVGFSVAYPLGVLLPLLAVYMLRRRAGAGRAATPELVARTARIAHDGLPPLGDIAHDHGHRVTFGRVKRGDAMLPAAWDLRPRAGDLVSVVGPRGAVLDVVEELGGLADEKVTLDRSDVDFRRVVVSREEVAGRRIADLDLGETLGAVVTRVRRGDIDLVADPDMRLALGDRVRVVAPRDGMADVSRFFGDSYRRLAEVDVLTFSVGIALGLLLGSIHLPLPGGGSLALGVAGGPLVAGLVLGWLGRTGPLLWQIPYGANLTLRQLGTVLFLAGIGVEAGQEFARTIVSAQAAGVLAAGLAATTAAVACAVLVGARVLRLSAPVLAGAIAGFHTQPAVLAFASDQFDDENEVNTGYATVYPLAMIAKIVAAQVLLRLLL
jgi:putative transport protein